MTIAMNKYVNNELNLEDEKADILYKWNGKRLFVKR